MTTSPSGWRTGAIVYWTLALLLTVFGFLAFAWIGAPFLVLGVAMFLMGPLRHRTRLFWPVIVGVFAFSAVFLVAAPFACERSGTLSPEGVEEAEQATCSSLIGIDYSGVGDWEPSYIPTLLAGLGIGAVAAVACHVLIRRGLATRS